MIHCNARWAVLTYLVLLAAVACAQNFSADFVSTRASGVGGSGKIFVSNDKVRYESDHTMATGGKPIMIMDFSQHATNMLMPDRRMYVSFPQGRGMTVPFWHLMDVNNACAEWQAYAAQMKTDSKVKSCHKAGTETLNGRSAVKYVITSEDGKIGTVWIDPNLKTMLKHASSNGTVELKNIKEGPQPASLFEIPKGYQQMAGMPGPSAR